MENEKEKEKKDQIVGFTALILMLAIAVVYSSAYPQTGSRVQSAVQENIAPEIDLGNLKEQMISAGVIDQKKFQEHESTLNYLWALGLGNKNPILETGPISDKRYGDAGGFASTGGWTFAKGPAVDHIGRHSFITLTEAQQSMVESMSKNIFRPCCDNSTYFPDCNHGMAMLGLLELLASQGKSESEIYKTAFLMNQLWFPNEYEVIERYLESKGQNIASADPKEILGANYSSASGYRKILQEVGPAEQKNGGGGCGVDSGKAAPAKSTGCGV